MPVSNHPGRAAARPVEITPQRLNTLQHLVERPSNARQGHGFNFETGLMRLLGYSPAVSYTSPVDAWEPGNGGYPVSFKHIKDRGPVELGSACRNAGVDRDFLFYVGFWAGPQRATKRVHTMLVDAQLWRAWFPADMEPFTAEAVFDGISNDYADDVKWRARAKELRALWREKKPEGSPIQVRFKRDHKKQKRVQCAIPFRHFERVFSAVFSAKHSAQLEDAFRQQEGLPSLIAV